jgi:hypothetical protein
MSQILRGNFTTKKSVTPDVEAPTLEQQFEREALKRLGGSIAFVSKKKLLWTGDAEVGSGGSSNPPGDDKR